MNYQQLQTEIENIISISDAAVRHNWYKYQFVGWNRVTKQLIPASGHRNKQFQQIEIKVKNSKSKIVLQSYQEKIISMYLYFPENIYELEWLDMALLELYHKFYIIIFVGNLFEFDYTDASEKLKFSYDTFVLQNSIEGESKCLIQDDILKNPKQS